jgi:hypothetical protein
MSISLKLPRPQRVQIVAQTFGVIKLANRIQSANPIAVLLASRSTRFRTTFGELGQHNSTRQIRACSS